MTSSTINRIALLSYKLFVLFCMVIDSTPLRLNKIANIFERLKWVDSYNCDYFLL